MGLLVLLVDMPKGISGVACQIPGADSILINRKDSEGRRNFDLAHELFHVLTWDALPPERVDRGSPSGSKAKSVQFVHCVSISTNTNLLNKGKANVL